MTDTVEWSMRRKLLSEELDESTLVYDLESNMVYCLEGEASQVLRAARSTTVEDVAEVTGIDTERVRALILQLLDRGLLEPQSAEPSVARRMLATAGVAALGAVTIWAINAPSAAASGIE